jgi:cytochrome c553
MLDATVHPGETLYLQQCANCHGQQAQIRALGRSARLVSLSTAEIIQSSLAYRDGNLNKHGMGKLMQSRIQGLDNHQIRSIAAYLETLKRDK